MGFYEKELKPGRFADDVKCVVERNDLSGIYRVLVHHWTSDVQYGGYHWFRHFTFDTHEFGKDEKAARTFAKKQEDEAAERHRKFEEGMRYAKAWRRA